MASLDSPTESLVKVFVRRVDKRAKSIKFSPTMLENELKEIVSCKLRIPLESLILYLHGS